MLIDNLDLGNRSIVVPDSKTSKRVTTCSDEPPRLRALEYTLWHNNGVWVFPFKRSASAHLL